MTLQSSETTALLADARCHEARGHQSFADGAAAADADDITADAERLFSKLPPGAVVETTRAAEAKYLVRCASPLMLTYVLQYSFNITTVIVAGRLGTPELGAVSLATMMANVSGLCVYEGLATSLDTLCSQAYGSRNKKMVGLHMQRMVCFLWLVTVPIGAIWICSPWILTVLVPEKELAILAGSFLRIFLLGAPGYATFEAGKRFMQAQGIFSASLVVLLIGAPLNVLLNWVFVWKLGWGIRGAAAAVSVTNSLQPILLLLYVRCIIPSSLQCWPGLSRRALRDWGPMVRLAVPGILMIEAEWLAFDILAFSSAYLGKTSLAAQSILFNVSVLMYHVPLPASIAASTRLGNLIGSGALEAARIAVSAYYLIFVVIGLFDLSVLMALKDVIAKIFSHDPEVQRLVSIVMPLCATFQLVDSTTALCNGLLRGLGRQYIGGWTNLLVYYVFSTPVSLFLAFGPPHLGLWGLWTGPAAGLAAVTVIVSTLIKRTSWQKCVEEAQRRSAGGWQ